MPARFFPGRAGVRSSSSTNPPKEHSMRSRMTPEQLAALRAKSANANELNNLANVASGFGVSRVDRERAAAALEQAVGARKAKRLKKDASRRAQGLS
jgi:hypothetical protein